MQLLMMLMEGLVLNGVIELMILKLTEEIHINIILVQLDVQLTQLVIKVLEIGCLIGLAGALGWLYRLE